MVRAGMFALGVGLLVLWLVGLGTGTAGWLMWLDFIGGLLSIAGGFALTRLRAGAERVAEPIVLSLGLFVLWIVALATNQLAWQTWLNFIGACLYLLLAIAAGSERPVTAVGRRTTA